MATRLLLAAGHLSGFTVQKVRNANQFGQLPCTLNPLFFFGIFLISSGKQMFSSAVMCG